VDQGKHELTQKTLSKEKHVRWSATIESTVEMSYRGILSPSICLSHYHGDFRTTPFILHIRFGGELRIGRHDSRTFRANLLLEFEYYVTMRFPEHTRPKLMGAMHKGYALGFCTRLLKKRTPIIIRGTSLVQPDAAFTSFLNCVPPNATVVLEWM
jgi:hypothetical protein